MCAIHSDGSGNGHMLENIGPVRHQGTHVNPRLTGAILEVLGGQHFIESLDMICRKKNYYLQKLNSLIDIAMLQLSRAKPGNPASRPYSYMVKA